MINREILTVELLFMSIANLCYWACLDIFLPVLPQHFHAVGLNDYQVGLIIGATSVGGMLFRVLAGKGIDRYGASPVAFFGLAVSLISIIGFFYAQTMTLAMLCTFGQGIGLACYSSACITMATLMFDEKHLTDVIAIYSLFGIAGASSATAIGNWLYSFAGFDAVITLGVVLAAISLLLIPKRPTVQVKVEKADSRPVREIAANPGVYVPTMSIFATNICFASIITFLPMLMLSRSVAEMSAFYVTYSATVITVRLFVGKLSALIGVTRLEWFAVTMIGAVMWLTVYAHNWFTLALCGVLLGLALGGAFPSMGTTVSNSTEPANRGVAFGIFTTAADTGFVIGAAGMGFVAALWGYQAIFILAGTYALLYAVAHKMFLAPRLKANVT